MTNIGSRAAGALSGRLKSVTLVTALLTSSFLVLAMSQDWSTPLSSSLDAPSAEILSPYAILEPSTKNNPNDKDGFPPSKSEADPEEAFLLGKVTVPQDIYDATATITEFDYDSVDDLTVDDDTPRDLDMLDGSDDGKLAAGTYYIYWNLNKTGYVPVNTTPGSPYNGSNSASISVVNDEDQMRLDLSYSPSEGGVLETISSDLYTITMWKSASISQNDLNWIDTQPKVVYANESDVFTVRSKYRQSSAQGLEWMILQCYYNGLPLRIVSVALYYYDDWNPGSIVDDVPSGWDKSWTDKQQFTNGDLGDTDNKDYWVTEYTFVVRAEGFSDIIPYIQTKKGGDTWKIDTGYTGFQSHVPGGVNPAKLSIAKYFSEDYPDGVVSGPNPPIVGQPTIYEINITVGNIGEDDAVNIVVTDTAQLDNVVWLGTYTLSQGSLTFDSVSGKITWSVGTLVPNDNATLSYQVSLTPTPDMVGSEVLLNSGAYATGKSKTSGQDITAGPTPPLYTEPVFGQPEMTIDKTSSQTTADPGDLITYTLHYENTGSSTAYDVVIMDTIPDYVTYSSSSPPYDSVSDRTYTWDIGDVAAGVFGDVTITVQVDVGTPDGTVLANLGRVEYDDYGGEPQPPKEDWENVTVTAPIMEFDKSVNKATANPGDYIIYILSYENKGNGTATNVVIVDTIPENVTFISSTPAPSDVSGREYTFELGDVLSGASGAITIEVQVDAFTSDGKILENIATLNYDDANGNPYPEQTDSTTTTVTAPIIDFDKSVNVEFVDPSDLIIYTLTIENIGTGYASNVVLKDTIPANTTFYHASPWYSSVSGKTYTWIFSSLAPDEIKTVTLKVTVDAYTPNGTVLTNTATLDYDDVNSNSYPQITDTATTTVTAPVMIFTKTADVTHADPTDIITYTLHYKNNGSGVATEVVVKDTIPENTTIYDAIPWFIGVSGSTYTWSIGTLGPGDEGDIILKVKVNAGTADGTILFNTATLDHKDANGNPYPQMSDDASVTVTAPVMTFSKDVDVQYADPGDLITYTLTYHNGGSGWTTDVVIKDTIPEHTTFQDSEPVYSSVSDRTYTWDIGSVGPGGGGTIMVTVKVDANTPDKTVLLNTATLDYKDANGNCYPQMSDNAVTTVTAPVMTFTKNVDLIFANPGDLIQYTLFYKNIGTGVATDVVIKDTIPEHVTFVSSDPDYSSVDVRTYTWEIGTVDPGASDTIIVTVEVDAFTPDKTILLNTATLDFDDANGNPCSQLSASAQTVVMAPVMTLAKVADVGTADPGDLVTYTLTYENSGTGDASLVEIVDTLPAQMTFIDATPYPDSISGNVLTWAIGDVSAGAVDTITVEARVNAYTTDGTVLHNVATLDYADMNGNYYPQLSACYDVTVTAPVVTFTKNADVTTADPGDIILYTLNYVNSGSGAATGAIVVDTLPDHVTFVDATPYPDSVSDKVLTWDIGTIDPFTSKNITVEVKVDAYTDDGTFLVNTATLDYNDANGNPYAQLTEDAEVTVTAPVVSLTKVADVQMANPGDYITYTISYYNAGSGDATGVTISDTLPDYVTFISSNPPYDDVSGKKYTWDIGTVVGDSGDSITIIVHVDVGTPDATPLHNVATLDYADANGNCYPQLTEDADVTVTAPVMDLSKGANVTTADPSDEITYLIEFVNSGSGNATGVYLNDTIPEHVVFLSSDPLYTNLSGRTYTWFWPLVVSGETVTVTITVKVDAYTSDQTLLHNYVTADYNDANGNPYPQLIAYADVTVTAPVFTFSKSADVSQADPGDFITYTIDWNNNGSGWATNVVIVDTLPLHVEFVSTTPAYTSSSGRTYTWDFGDIAPYDLGQVTIIVQVIVGTSDTTKLHNVATLDYADANGNCYPQMTDYADVVVTAPVMTFMKIGDATTADPGDYITYTLTYENIGTGVASNVVISDTLPDHVTFISSDPSYTNWTGKTYTWIIGTLGGGAGDYISIKVQVDVHTADKTLLHNTATLNYADANGNPYPQLDRYWDIRVTAPVMTFSKSANVSLADPGDIVVYTLEYENNGTGSASNVIIVDTLHADITFISASLPPDSIVGQVLTWNIGTVDPSGFGTITVTVQVNAGTKDRTLLRNIATLDYSDANGNFVEQLTAIADVIATAPVMTFDKYAGDVTVSMYVMANFTLRIAGEKWHDVRLMLIDDNISVAFASVTRYPGSPDDQAVTIYDVKIDLLGSFQAVIVYTPPDDPINGNYPGDNPCWLTLTFRDGSTKRLFHNFNVNHEHTWIWIVDDFRPYVKHQAVTYEGRIPYIITYWNIGSGDASEVVVTDTFQAGSVILDSNPPYDSCIVNVCTWNIGAVVSGGRGFIFVNISYIFEVNNTIVVNTATLDYSDANGNFIEQLSDSVQSILVKPDIDDKKGKKSIDGNTKVGTIKGPPAMNTASGDEILSGQIPIGISTDIMTQSIESEDLIPVDVGAIVDSECGIITRPIVAEPPISPLPITTIEQVTATNDLTSSRTELDYSEDVVRAETVDAVMPPEVSTDASALTTLSMNEPSITLEQTPTLQLVSLLQACALDASGIWSRARSD